MSSPTFPSVHTLSTSTSSPRRPPNCPTFFNCHWHLANRSVPAPKKPAVQLSYRLSIHWSSIIQTLNPPVSLPAERVTLR